jgi:hypothetical protein
LLLQQLLPSAPTIFISLKTLLAGMGTAALILFRVANLRRLATLESKQQHEEYS